MAFESTARLCFDKADTEDNDRTKSPLSTEYCEDEVFLTPTDILFAQKGKAMRKEGKDFRYWMIGLVLFLAGCTPTMQMKNVRSSGLLQEKCASGECPKPTEGKFELMIQPHQSLGLEPTAAVRSGNISTYLVVFPEVLFAEWAPGRLRWNTLTIGDDGSEHFGQIIFAGVHDDGYFFSVLVLDGQIDSGQTVILSTMVDFIYSPFSKEVAVERTKFLADPNYRSKMVQEANTYPDGEVFNIKSLSRRSNFQSVLKNWNQIMYPEGYLLSPLGVEEVALIRGINPQYSYFQKLVGTGKFALRLSFDPVGMAISNATGVAMDLLKAWGAPTKGWDYMSQVPDRRYVAFIMDYKDRLRFEKVKQKEKLS